MARVFKIKTFFTQKELKVLAIKTKQEKYKRFIKEIHRRIVQEMLLGSKEGFILPYRLGHISLKQTQRVSGVKLRHMFNPAIDEQLEYNAHTFGNVYELNWNKERFLGMELKYHKQHYFPDYNGFIMLFLKCYNFKAVTQVKKIIKYQIENRELNLV